MIFFGNYHAHTEYSDGKSKISEYIAQAKNLGLKSIGISDHAPVPFQSNWNMISSKVNEYIDQLNRLKQKNAEIIDVYCGMEVDFYLPFKQEILALANISKLDYTIGSIHYLGTLNNGSPWCIDTTKEEFDNGFQQIFQSNGKKLIEMYFEQLALMITIIKPTIVGHIDKIRMYTPYYPYFDEQSIEYRSAIIEILKLVKTYDIIIELNMRGTYKHEFRLTYPDFWVLKEMNKLGIRVIVSSDSHHTSEITKNFRLAYQLLKQAGYNTIWQLKGGKWIAIEVE